jgi:two-component system cell cycle response regulator
METHYKIKGIEEIYTLAKEISQYFPEKNKAQLVITEILFNSIEHGNLAIGYQEKTELIKNNQLENEYRKRLQENPHKFITIVVKKNDKQISIKVKDMGAGFNHKKFTLKHSLHDDKPNGRGIGLIKINADKLFYNRKGNECLCIFYINKQ